jgi:diacylglycerol kinase family enzyme
MKDIFSDSRVTCLVNPKAANSKWLRRSRLHDRLLSILRCRLIDPLGDPRTTTDEAKKACTDSDIVIAMGGDGTIADVIQGIVESGRSRDVKFTVIPFGSGNAFRKSFAVPKNPHKAVRLLAQGIVRRIDLMEVCGRYAGFSSVGATALITGEKLKNPIHGLWGHILAGVKLFSASRDEKQILLEDGVCPEGPFRRKVVKSRFLDAIISKTNYFGYSWLVAPHARVDDGYLDVNLFELGPVRYALLFPLIYFGLYQRRCKNHFKAKRIVISGRDIPIQVNGEFIGSRDTVEFRVVPDALSIVIPSTKKALKWFSAADA